MKKGQGTFEYILLLAGVLLIVVLAIVLIRGGLFQPSQQNIQRDACRGALVQSTACYLASGVWNDTGYVIASAVSTCGVIATPAPAAGCDATQPAGSYTTIGSDRYYCCGAKPT